MNSKKRILSLSPHPDDTELGAGGFLSKAIDENCDVFVAVFSYCRESLPDRTENDILSTEFNQSMELLGVPESHRSMLDYPVRRFSEHRQDILEELVKLRIRISPDLVLLPASFDIHQDHRIIYEEGVRSFLRNASILGYELPWNMRSFDAQHIVKLEEKDLEKKISVIRAYRSQIEIGRSYFSESFIRGLAETRGVQGGCKLAEAFEVIRLYG